jgi:hypothetical protein
VSRTRAIALLVAGAIVVGLLVATVSVVSGAENCGAGAAAGACLDLVRTMAARVGLVTGVAVMVMVLLVIGLARMRDQDERRRLEVAAMREGEGGSGDGRGL